MLERWDASVKFVLRFLRRDLLACHPQHASLNAVRKLEEMWKKEQHVASKNVLLAQQCSFIFFKGKWSKEKQRKREVIHPV